MYVTNTRVSLLLCFTAASIFAMETNDAELQPWVRNASKIHVSRIKGAYSIDIGNATTVGDVKQNLEENEGIPVSQQSITAVWPMWWSLGFKSDRSAPLANDTNVKTIMNNYNTNCFELWLQLRDQNPDNK
jgi:hypothetical protein